MEGNSGSTAETAGSYFTGTILHNVNREGDNVGYKTVTSTLSRSSIAFGTRVTNWVMYVDAVRQALSVSVSPTSWTMDMGQSKTFTATPSGGSGSYTRYQWYVGGVAQSGATASTFSYSPASAGSHSITVTVTDSLGVTSPQSTGVTVTVNSALVAPTASASMSTVDQGQTSALSSTAVSTGTSPYTYQWLEKAPGAGSYSPISDATSSGYSFVTSGSTTIGSWSFELQVTDNASAPVVVTSIAVSVLVNAAPTVTVSPTSWTMDVGQSKTFTATASGGSASYTSYQWYVDGLLAQSGTASVMPFTPGSSGTYLITVTVTDSLGATSALSSAASVTVAASPTVSVAPVGPLTMDAGQVQAFTATASGGSGTINYQWYLDSSAVGSNSASYSYTASAGLHSVTCKVTDSASTPVTSPASNVVSVTVNSALAAPTVTPTPGTVDQGQTSSLTSTAVSTGTSPYTYQWFEKAPGGSYVMVGSNSGSFSFATSGSTVAGSWSFILEVTDNVGAAVNSTAVSVAVNAAPSVTVSPTSWTMDVGQSKTFSATPSGGSGSYTSYQWYVNGVSQPGQTALTFSFAPVAAGAYSVTVAVTDSLGATSAQSTAASVTVAASPTVSIAPVGPLTMDAGQVQAFTATASGGSGTISYQWYVDGTAVGTNSVSYSYTASGASHSVTCTVTDSASTPVTSPASNAVTITVSASPTVSIAPVGPLMMDAGQVQAFTATASGGSGTINYQWYLDGSAVSGATSSTFSFSGSVGSYSVTCKVTDSASTPVTSPASNAVSVTVNSALVAPTVTPIPGTVDQGQTSALSSTAVSTGTSPYTYQWLQKAPGASSYSAISDATSSGYSFATSGSTATGVWSFELQVTDSAGAVVTSSAATVTVNAAPTVTVSPTSWTMDVVQSKTFTAAASGGSGSYTSYQWYVNGSAQSGQTAQTFSYSPVAAGSYSVTVTVTDSLGATSAQSTAATVTVNSALAAPTVTPTLGTVDQGQTSSLASTAVSTGTSPYTYQWFEKASGGSYVMVGSNSGSFSFATSGSTATGSWSFILQVTDNTGAAVNSTAVSVAVNAAPSVSIAPVGPVTLDAGQAQTFTASASGGTGTLTYQWYLNGSPVGVDSNTYIFSGSAGSYSVTCTVTDSAFMPASATSNAVSVTVNQLTITVTQGANGVIAPGTITVNYGGSQTFTITPNTGYYIASLSVDGSPVTAASSYTFSNIQASHTITATFAINTYTITVTQGANGVIAPGTTTVDYGATPSFSITPNTGYHIASITVDGVSVAVTSPSGQSYQFSAVSSDGSLTATFAITTSTRPTASPPSPTPTVSSPSPTPTVSSPSPTPTVSSPSPTPTVSPPSPTPLYLVLAAVIIVAAIIILIFSVIAIKRRRRKLDSTLPNPENKYTKTNVLAANEEQEIASLKGKIEKIKNLEAEKKNLLLEIEKLKKRADAKAAT